MSIKMTETEIDATLIPNDEEAYSNDKNNKNPLERFHQIRKKFEKSQGSNTHSAVEQHVQKQETNSKTDFQKQYPLFQRHFTKRQFTVMEDCFKKADKNCDGFLQAKEVKQLFSEYQQPINLCEANIILNGGDKNRDGKLCPQEFLQLCIPATETLRQERFKEGSTLLSDQEFIQKILYQVKCLVEASVENTRVHGTRLYFENMSSGSCMNNNENKKMSTFKKTVADRYLQTISGTEESPADTTKLENI